MFANLGSLGSLDLNSTFAQLTNLSLDSLQKNEEQTKTAEAVATNSNDNKKADQATMRHEHDEALIAELQKLLKQRDEEIRSLQSDLQRNEKEKCTTEAAQSDRTNQLEEELRRVIQSNGELKEQLGEAQRTVQQHQAQLTVSSSTTGKKNKKGKAVIAEEHMHTAPPSEAQDELVSSLRAQMAEMSQQLLGYQKQCGEHEQLARLYEEQRAAYASKCRVYEELSADKDQQSQLLAQREAKHVAIHKTWRDDLEALQKENQQLASQLQSAQQENGRLTSQTAEQAALAGKLQETQQKVTSLTEDCEALKQQLACEKDKGEALKAQLQQSTAQGENASSTLLSQLSAAQAMVEKKEKTAQELQDKLQGAADKLRELMQKYVDAKNKNAQLEQSLVELRKEQEKALGQKESELVKQRLKLETAEHSLAEAKRKVTELQEKFGENQRSVAEMKGSIESLLKEQDRNAEAAQQLAALRTEHEQAVERHSLQLSNLKDEYSQLVCDKEIRLDTVTRQLQSLQSAQRSEEDAAAALENYKKRAQLSLKKANATISGLQEELHKAEQDKQAINAHNSELTALVQDLQETVKSLQLECQTLTDKALELQQDQNRLQMELESLRSAAYRNSLVEVANPTTPAQQVHEEQAVVREHSNSGRHEVAVHPAHIVEDFETEDDKSVSSAKSNHHTLEFGGGVASTEIAVVKQQTGLIVATSNNTEPMSYARDISNHVSTTPRVIASPKVVGQEPEERFLLVEQLQEHIKEMRAELAACRMDLDQAHVVVQREREEKAAALRNLEELRAYLERIKTLHASHSESAINIEYLKTCVFRFMASSSASERQRLAPVISTILNFTSSERHQIEELHRPTSNTRDGSSLLGDNTLSDIGSSLESWLGINPNSLFGSGT